MEARSLGGFVSWRMMAIWEGRNLLEGLSVGFCEGAHCYSLYGVNGMRWEEDIRSLSPYISLGDVLHDIFKSFRSPATSKEGLGDILFCNLTSTPSKTCGIHHSSLHTKLRYALGSEMSASRLW